jgi:hypothetical protein
LRFYAFPLPVTSEYPRFVRYSGEQAHFADGIRFHRLADCISDFSEAGSCVTTSSQAGGHGNTTL